MPPVEDKVAVVPKVELSLETSKAAPPLGAVAVMLPEMPDPVTTTLVELDAVP